MTNEDASTIAKKLERDYLLARRDVSAAELAMWTAHIAHKEAERAGTGPEILEALASYDLTQQSIHGLVMVLNAVDLKKHNSFVARQKAEIETSANMAEYSGALTPPEAA